MDQPTMTEEERILTEAEAKTAQAYADNPTVAASRDWKAAKKALEEFRAKKAFPAAESFKNVERAAEWVIDQGYIVTARTVRNHANGVAGFPRRQKDGSYLKSEIASYAAATWENPSRPKDEPKDADYTDQVKRETARKLKLDNDIKEQKYLLRTLVEQRCATAASYLKTDLSNFGPRVCDRLIDKVSEYLSGQGLDLEDVNLQAVIPDLLEEYDRKLDSWLDRYARETVFPAEGA